jgi:hypothetical protein
MPNRWWWVLLNHCKPSREEVAKKPVEEPGEAMIRSTGTTRIGRSLNQLIAGKIARLPDARFAGFSNLGDRSHNNSLQFVNPKIRRFGIC